MLALLVYFNSALSFATTFLLAHKLGASSYATVAFGLAVGAFGFVCVNIGSDQVQIRCLTYCKSSLLRKKSALINFWFRLGAVFVFLILSSILIYFIFDLNELPIVVLICIWAAIQGLLPNAYFDFLGAHKIQQTIILIERVTSILAIYTIFEYCFFVDKMQLVKVMALGLLLIRILLIAIQYVITLKIDRKDGSLAPASQINEGPMSSFGISGHLAISGVALATVAYFSQILLKVFTKPEELSVYSLCFQSMSFISIFQVTFVRLLSREAINEIGRETLGWEMVRRQALKLAYISAVLATGGVLVSVVLVRYVLNIDNVLLTIGISSILAVWIIFVGYGQAITRYMNLLGHESRYFRHAIIGAVASVCMGYFSVKYFQSTGAAITLLFVHGMMIFANSVFLKGCLKK